MDHRFLRRTNPRLSSRWPALLVPLLGLACASPVLHADNGKPTATEASQRAALRIDVAKRLAAKGVSKAGIDHILANLEQFDMAQLRGLAGFSGEAATGADRLLPGSAGNARDRAGELTGGAGIGSGGASASERGITGALAPGMRDTSGHAADGVGSCAACRAEPGAEEKKEDATFGFYAGSKSSDMPNDGAPSKAVKPAKQGDGSTRFRTADGTWISTYPDGSARITKNGQSEYVSSRHRLVDKNGNAKEPRPDGDRSGGFTYADLKRVSALLGQHSQPAGTDGNSAGGPVDAGRTDPTGSRGLYTDARIGGGYVAEADMREILRIAIEKLGGPVGR